MMTWAAENNSKDKVLLAMSGGIDSSASAILLLEKGFQVIGLTMQMYESKENDNSEDAFNENKPDEAKHIANQLGIEHYTIDVRKEFENTIIKNFTGEYFSGRTPNPCVLCNRMIKWAYLEKMAKKWNCKYIATGHYARKVKEDNGYYSIYKAKDKRKDQSYFLYGLNQTILKKTIFPLGESHKTELKKIVEKRNLHFLNQKKESMEICFIPHDNYRQFLMNRNPEFLRNLGEGDFVSTNGKYLGKHKGFPYYTIGQRRGLEIAVGYPLYVVEIRPETNTVVLGKREELYKKELEASAVNFIAPVESSFPIEIKARVRYNHKGTQAKLYKTNDSVKVEFGQPVFAITPGQSVVFYDKDRLLGGALIE